MTDEPENLVLRQLRAMDDKLDRVLAGLRDHGARLSAIEARIGAVESRLDIWNERIARLEVRVGLAEEATTP